MDYEKLYKEKRAVAIAKERLARKIKTYKGDFYTINSILGNTWAMFYILLGGREAGKSYSAMKWAVINKIKKKDNLKFYWMRLTKSAKDKLLCGKAKDLIDPDIKRKYKLNVTTKGDTVYTYKEKKITHIKNGEEVEETVKYDKQEFCRVLDCATFYNDKGIGYFDNEYKGEYVIILDEMNREESEKNNFDIVYNFVNQLENIVRSTKTNIKVIMIGNTLEEASDILTAFNFIPDTFGRYKLKRKRCVIDYIKPNKKYLERRKGTIADILMSEASTFTNEVQIDRSLLVNKRERRRASTIIKFGKTRDCWFTVWNNSIIAPYNNETVNNIIPMKRYLDEVFTSEAQQSIIDMWDVRSFKFINLSVLKRFQKQMKLLKKQ